MLKILLWSLLTLLVASSSALPQEGSSLKDSNILKDSIKTYSFPQVDIIGESPSLFNRIPGSAYLITFRDMKSTMPLTGNEMFRTIPGINVVDEEGIGLRMNIGLRGLDPDRSRTSLVLEDGIPVALAPYGEPELYYTPPIDRMSGIEIIKGSGSILFGPQTIGGVINYKTPDPPETHSTGLNIRGGEGGYVSGILNYGTSFKNVGVYTNFMHKQGDKVGTLKFDVNDLTSKFRFELSPKSILGLKLGFYDEKSNSTYVGITQTMYDKGDYYTDIAPYDELKIRRYSASLTLDHEFNKDVTMKTTAYGYTTSRDWRRQDFSRNSNVSNLTGVVFGDTTLTGGAIYMRNSTGNRDRQFQVFGFEPRIFATYNLGTLRSEFDGGIRVHYEKAFEQRINGTKFDAISGTLRDDEDRTGYAYTVFAQNRFYLSKELSVVPGLRYEKFDYARDIYRLNAIDTNITNSSSISEFIPGLGINYNINDRVIFFAGVHKGFAPPRVKDAINNSGVDLELAPERSWNYEAGTRLNLNKDLSFELTGYLLDFSNQIIPVSQSSGGTGTGLVNGGETRHTGIEAGFNYNIGSLFSRDVNLLLGAGVSFNKAEYTGDRFIQRGNETVNIKGNTLPYAPEMILNSMIDLRTNFGLNLRLNGNYVGKQFADELNTIEASNNGLIGEIPARFVLDVTGKYLISSLNTSLFVSVKNLLDERFIANRRPEGIKVGLPRFITAGFELNL